MTILYIERKKQRCGTLECDRGSFRWIGEYDEDFKKFLETSVAEGIPAYADHHDKTEETFSIEKVLVKKDDIEPYVLRDFLRHEGYDVRENHPEIEQEIRALIEEVPDDNPDKKTLLENLPLMSNLEQTAILQKLREADKE